MKNSSDAGANNSSSMDVPLSYKKGCFVDEIIKVATEGETRYGKDSGINGDPRIT